MKKIINGSRYNTETAQRLGTHETGLPGDINHRGQELYRTKAGKYFIYLYGNGFPKPDGWWGWGEEITPITEDAARQWAEQHLDGDAYEAAFGEVVEDARLNILLPAATAARLCVPPCVRTLRVKPCRRLRIYPGRHLAICTSLSQHQSGKAATGFSAAAALIAAKLWSCRAVPSPTPSRLAADA